MMSDNIPRNMYSSQGTKE